MADRIKFIPGKRITKSDEELERIEIARREREIYHNSLDQIVIRRSRFIFTRAELNISSADEEEDDVNE